MRSAMHRFRAASGLQAWIFGSASDWCFALRIHAPFGSRGGEPKPLGNFACCSPRRTGNSYLFHEDFPNFDRPRWTSGFSRRFRPKAGRQLAKTGQRTLRGGTAKIMSATASDNSAMHDYLVTGETLFVTGAVLAFVSDVALTFRSLVALHWLGLTLGFVFILGTMYIVNWLYTGKKEARTPAAIWAAVQIVVALIGTILLMNLDFRWDYRLYPAGRTVPQALSVQSYLLGAFKVASYGLLLYLVTQRGPALFFLRYKGGESVEVPSPTAPPE